MCGRYTHLFTWAELHRLMRLATVPEEELPPRYNVAPTQPAPVVLMREGQRAGTLMRWGLIPSWADDPSIGSRMINARSETVWDKPAFRSAVRRRRCLVPASGFYEWQAAGKGQPKQPFYFHPADGGVLAMAGLWERADRLDGAETFTILTTEANALVRPVHPRMPAILPPDSWEVWLDPSLDDRDRLGALLRPCDEGLLRSYAVRTHVNSPRNDDPACIESA